MDPFFAASAGYLVAGWHRDKDTDARRQAFTTFVQSYGAVSGGVSGGGAGSGGAPGKTVAAPSWSDTRRRGALRKYAKRQGIERQRKHRDPKKWGPVTWKFLRSAALKFSLATKASFWQMLKNLGPLLPCPKCRANFPELLSLERWAAVNSPETCLSYVSWMESSVAARRKK
jgi:hypothetical protein